MLDMLRSAMEMANIGVIVDVVFHDGDTLTHRSVLGFDQLGIAVGNPAKDMLASVIPWTAIAVLNIHQP